MPPPDEPHEDRWQFRLNLLGLLLVAILAALFFVLYGTDLLNFLNMLFGPPQGPF